MRALSPLKGIVKATLAAGPVWRLAGRSVEPGCVVLLYHRIGKPGDSFPHLDVRRFASQMRWLRANCDVIAPEDLRPRVTGSVRSARPAVLVTFDDGYRDYFEHAYPVLRSLGIRALNFLCTQFVDDPTRIGWWDRLDLALRVTRRSSVVAPWGGDVFGLDRTGKARFLRAVKDHIKERPDAQALADSVVERLDVDQAAIGAPRQTMSWDEVRAAADHTCYGGHTHSHVILSRLDDATLDREIATCRARIEAETRKAPQLFAYPNGRSEDFDDRAKDSLRRHGFDTAFVAIAGLNRADTNWLEVRRITAGDSASELAWRISRLYR